MSTAQSCNFSILYKIPYFETPSEGSTHFNVGLCIGKQFKDQINEYLTRSDLPFQSIYLPYVLSKKDDQDESRRIEKEAQSTSSEGDHYALLRPWIQLVDEHFPKYVQEIRGLAAGSEQLFEWLFMLNMLNELRNKILHDERLKDKKTTKVGGCSEVFVCCKTSEMERALMAHNEDADKSIGEYSYIVKSNYLEENGSVRSMVAYHYPGTIGGNTFGWNEYLVFGTNGKSPKKTLTESCGIPRCFINRYVYESKSIEEVHTRLEEYALLSSSGFSTNVSTRFIVKDDVNDFYQMANIELAPSLDGKEKQVSKYSIPIKRNNSDQPHYVHVNHYLHLMNIPEEEVPSSRHRYARAMCHSNIISENEIIQLLGDTEDKEYPIFRTSNHPDKGKTLATFIVNIIEQTVNIYVGNPIHTPPLYTMTLF